LSDFIPKNIIDDFKTWTGGWDPKEEDEEKIEEYIEFAMSGSLTGIIKNYDDFMIYVYGERNY